MKKKLVAGLTSLAALVAVGGTFAYFTTSQTFDNEFTTTSFGGETIEKFNPGEATEWKPGAKVEKKVSAKNTGAGDLWVRIKLVENWDGVGSSTDVKTKELTGEDVETYYQKSLTDGYTNDDKTVVDKEFDSSKTNDWFLAADGYYYYKKTLGAGDEAKLLNSVTLNKDADMGNFVEKTYFAFATKPAEGENERPAFPEGTIAQKPESGAQENTWYEGVPGNDLKGKDVWTKKVKVPGTNNGYAGANYTLTITSELIQADLKTAQSEGWAYYLKPGTTEGTEVLTEVPAE